MGDRAILGNRSDGVGMGSLHFDKLDANSKLTETFSEPRTIANKTVFLTKVDAETFDAWTDRSVTVQTNGTTFERVKAALSEFLER
jgi:hypothetical protein